MSNARPCVVCARGQHRVPCACPCHKAAEPAVEPLDVDAIEAKWLQMCGSCDAGMPVQCRCPEEDFRNVMSDLVAEVRRFRCPQVGSKSREEAT